MVHPADIQDRHGLKLLLCKAATLFPTITRIWADAGYRGQVIEWVAGWCKWILEIVSRQRNAEGFELLPRRWVIERTFAWFNYYRRLSKDYEYLVHNSEAMIEISMTQLMLHRICRPTPRQRR